MNSEINYLTRLGRITNVTISPTLPPAGFEVKIDWTDPTVELVSVNLGIIYALSWAATRSMNEVLDRDQWKDPSRRTAEVRYVNVQNRSRYKDLVWALQDVARTMYARKSYKVCTFRVFVAAQGYGIGHISPQRVIEAYSNGTAIGVPESSNHQGDTGVPPWNRGRISANVSTSNSLSGTYPDLPTNASISALPDIRYEFLDPKRNVNVRATLWILVEVFSRHAFHDPGSLVNSYTIRDPANLVELIIVGDRTTPHVLSRNEYFVYSFSFLAMLLYDTSQWYEVGLGMSVDGYNIGGFQLRRVQRSSLGSGAGGLNATGTAVQKVTQS